MVGRNMKQLISLIERRKSVGKKKSYTKGGNYNDFIEHERLGQLILREVYRLYDEGKLREE